MLNEITKGMDNAAEKINENFLNGGVVERGSNGNGEYTKYASGLAIIYKNIFIENVERVNFTEALPIKFKDNRVGCFMFASDNSVREVENI